MKKYIISILVASVFLMGAPFVVPKASASDMSVRDFINLLIIIGVISPDKIPAVNAYLATLNNPATPSVQLTNTLIPSTTFMNFNIVQGSANPQPTSFVLTNASSAMINFTISVPNQPAWLNTGYNTQMMSVNAGGVIGIGVSVDASKINSPGTYTTNLIFTGNFPNSPITVPITLAVSSSASQPVSVISPNGGETITAGQTYQIVWNTNDISSSQDMQITLVNSNTGELAKITSGCIEQGVVAPIPSGEQSARYLLGNCSGLNSPVKNTGSYTWSVPANLPAGSHYYIYVGESKIMGDSDFSDNHFTVVAPANTTLPSINLMTPTQGSAGTVVTISGTNLSGASSVEFYAAGSQFMGSLPPSSVSPNSLTFTISGLFAANMTPGLYQVGVVTNACAGGCDSNRIGFTLTSPVTQSTATILTSTQVTNTTPYIIGTASGVTQIGIVLVGQSGDKIYGSGLIPIINGNWSVNISPPLSLGQYKINVYDVNNYLLTSKPLEIISLAPTCSITSDKTSYTLDDTIVFSWTSQNATYATFWQDDSGKDHLNLPGDKLNISGSQSVTANVIGNPSAKLLIYNANNNNSCSITIPVN